MIKAFYLITATAMLLGSGQLTTSGNNNKQPNHIDAEMDTLTNRIIAISQDRVHQSNLFSLADAEKILGEQAHLTDSLLTTKGDTLTCSYAYTAKAKDQKTGKTGVVFFMLEQYTQVSSAQKNIHPFILLIKITKA